MEIEPEKVGMAADAPAKQYLVRRSKKLPAWLWISIAQALGIRIRPNDRAIVATVLYASTIVSALGKCLLFIGEKLSRNASWFFISVSYLYQHLCHRRICPTFTCRRVEE